MIVLNKRDWEQQMARFNRAVGKSVEAMSKDVQKKIIRAVALQTLKAIIANHRYPGVVGKDGRLEEMRDPVRTGRLRAGWGLAGKAVGLPVQTEMLEKNTSARGSDGSGSERASLARYALELTNNVEYVEAIEFGTNITPARTPVTRALAAIERIIEDVEPSAEARKTVNGAFRAAGFPVYERGK